MESDLYISRSKFAPVAPLELLQGLAKEEGKNRLPPYLLVLAHDVFARKEKYHALYDENRHHVSRQTTYDYNYIQTTILDNSIIELKGKIAPDEMIFGAAEAIQPKVVVLPDAFHDRAKTFEMAAEAKGRWEVALDAATKRPVGRPRSYEFLYVLQGQTFNDYAKALDDARRIGAKWISIPRNVLTLLPTRQKLIDLAHAVMPEATIHLLGFSQNPIDDILCARSPWVRGIDSAVPFRMASDDVEMTVTDLIEYDKPRGEWWDEATWVDMHWQNYVDTVRWVTDVI